MKAENAKPFEHDLIPTNPFEEVDLHGILGYQKALTAVFNHLAKVTQFKPENRYVDAVEIIDRITATTDQLAPILQREQDRIHNLLNS